MGEPQPGDFPDPINVKTANILLKATQIGLSGGYARFNSSGTPAWEVITTTLVTVQGPVIGAGFVQLQQDVNSTGLADAVANAGAFGPGSWFYGLANSTIEPNAFVILTRAGTQFGFEDTINITPAATGAQAATSVMTITFTVPHLFRVGDIISTSGFTPSDFNEVDRIITAITLTTIVYATAASDATSTVAGPVSEPVNATNANAQYIKKSGDTFEAGAVLNDICVFSMLKGGQAIA